MDVDSQTQIISGRWSIYPGFHRIGSAFSPYAGIMLALVWCFAMLLVVAKDAVRLIRWRYEYESSIARVVRSRRKAK